MNNYMISIATFMAPQGKSEGSGVNPCLILGDDFLMAAEQIERAHSARNFLWKIGLFRLKKRLFWLKLIFNV